MTWNFNRSHLRGMVWCKYQVCVLVEHGQRSVPYQMKRRTHFHQRRRGGQRTAARASQGRFILTLCSQAAGLALLALLVLPGLAVR